MNFDDEKAKLRRNLVVFCTVYLAGAYLDITLQQIANQTIFSKSEISIPMHKGIFISAVIYFYLALRWFSSEENATQYKALQEDFRSHLKQQTLIWLHQRVKLQRFDEHFDVYSQGEKSQYEERITALKTKFGSVDVSGQVTGVKNVSLFSGIYLMELQLTAPGYHGATAQPVNFRASLPLHVRAKVLWSCASHVAGRSAFWECAPPFVLAIATLAVIGVRFVTVIGARWL